MTDLKERYQAAQAKILKAREEAKEIAKEAFADGAKSVFEALPDLQSFGWTQYTPYFNDGDECIFSAHTDDPYGIYVNGENGDELMSEAVPYPSGVSWKDPEYKEWSERQKAWQDEHLGPIMDFLAIFSNEDLKEMFGDHQRITAYRDGRVETEYYEHD